jgi:hypothetical protein
MDTGYHLDANIKDKIEKILSSVDFDKCWRMYLMANINLYANKYEFKEDLYALTSECLYHGYDVYESEIWKIIVEYDEDDDIEYIYIMFTPMVYSYDVASKDNVGEDGLVVVDYSQVDNLRELMQFFVSQENYEKAAEIKAQIEKMDRDKRNAL